MPLKLLNALSAELPISGERLATEFDCTRAAIAKRITLLKKMGVLIEAIPRVGYRLKYAYEFWDESRLVSSMARESVAAQIHVLDSVDSTNAWMRRYLINTNVGGCHLAVTDFQISGQGRRGRKWLTLPGRQMTASIGYVSTQGPMAWVGIGIVIGISLASTLRKNGWPVTLKWPNDLVIGDAKLGGILVEMDAMSEGPSQLIVGFGINEALTAEERENLARPVAALQDDRQPYDRHALFAELSIGLVNAIREFTQSGLSPWQRQWAELDALHNRAVVFDYHGEWLEGIAAGIDEQGALLINTAAGRVRCHSGDVSVRVKHEAIA